MKAVLNFCVKVAMGSKLTVFSCYSNIFFKNCLVFA